MQDGKALLPYMNLAGENWLERNAFKSDEKLTMGRSTTQKKKKLLW